VCAHTLLGCACCWKGVEGLDVVGWVPCCFVALVVGHCRNAAGGVAWLLVWSCLLVLQLNALLVQLRGRSEHANSYSSLCFRLVSLLIIIIIAGHHSLPAIGPAPQIFPSDF
jgi:hypothetical protein